MALPLLKEKFDVKDFIYSDTALANKIDNSPSPEHLRNIVFLHQGLLNLQRAVSEVYGRKIEIQLNSVYRSFALNEYLRKKYKRASKTSQHMEGLAADLDAIGLGHDEFYQCIKKLAQGKKIVFDQLIKEFGSHPEKESDDWVHFSKKPEGNRLQCLISFPGKPYQADQLS